MSAIITDKDHVALLKVSIDAVGCLQPIIVDGTNGKVLIGKHRKESYPDCPEIVKYPKTDVERVLIEIHGDVQRTISREETRYKLTKLAKALEQEGKPKEEICGLVAKMCPHLSDGYVRQLLPKEYKHEEKVRNSVTQTSVPEHELSSPLVNEATKQAESALTALEKFEDVAPDYPFKNCICNICEHKEECY